MLQRPKAVNDEEVKKIGGLRSLNPKEKEELSKIIGCKQEEITNQPIVKIVSEKVIPLPDFADVVTLLIDQIPNAHAKQKFKDFFIHPHHDAPIVKGIIQWASGNTREINPISVYYQYYI